MQYAAGYFDNFLVFVAMRILQGVAMSMCNPAAFSLIRDYFPPEYRSTANSIYSSGIYVGQAVSSLSILLIDNYGWRENYMITGLYGAAVALLAALILSEPPRNLSSKQIMQIDSPKRNDTEFTRIST
jgi:MFS family permease